MVEEAPAAFSKAGAVKEWLIANVTTEWKTITEWYKLMDDDRIGSRKFRQTVYQWFDPTQSQVTSALDLGMEKKEGTIILIRNPNYEKPPPPKRAMPEVEFPDEDFDPGLGPIGPPEVPVPIPPLEPPLSQSDETESDKSSEEEGKTEELEQLPDNLPILRQAIIDKLDWVAVGDSLRKRLYKFENTYEIQNWFIGNHLDIVQEIQVIDPENRTHYIDLILTKLVEDGRLTKKNISGRDMYRYSSPVITMAGGRSQSEESTLFFAAEPVLAQDPMLEKVYNEKKTADNALRKAVPRGKS